MKARIVSSITSVNHHCNFLSVHNLCLVYRDQHFSFLLLFSLTNISLSCTVTTSTCCRLSIYSYHITESVICTTRVAVAHDACCLTTQSCNHAQSELWNNTVDKTRNFVNSNAASAQKTHFTTIFAPAQMVPEITANLDGQDEQWPYKWRLQRNALHSRGKLALTQFNIRRKRFYQNVFKFPMSFQNRRQITINKRITVAKGTEVGCYFTNKYRTAYLHTGSPHDSFITLQSWQKPMHWAEHNNSDWLWHGDCQQISRQPKHSC